MSQQIDRRTLLRGAGAMLGLPLLEAMLPLTALAQSASGKRPLRMAFLFVPNGIHMPDWTPAAEGAGFKLPYLLEPLAPVRESLLVMSGLTQDGAFAHGDGGGDHARSSAAWLTGCHPKKTSGADIRAGVSFDQIAAQRLSKVTAFPSLELACEKGQQAGDCDTGYSCAYTSTISWRSESTPVPRETDPRQVYQRLFAIGDGLETAESRARRVSDTRSILDAVSEDSRQLQAKLGRRDNQKLDEYFTSVRDIEQRIDRVEKVRDSLRADLPTFESEAGNVYGDQVRLMCDMIALAFQADLTRVCTFMIDSEGSNRSYRNVGVPEGHHEVSHHGGDPAKQAKIRAINRFHTEKLAYLLQKLKSIPEGDGTVLDNSMIVYGGGISDGNAHNHNNLPILMAGGRNAGIKTGRHVRYADRTPMSNLFLAMADRMALPVGRVGDSTGRLDQLF